MDQMPEVLRELMETLRADLIDTSVRVGEESELATAAIRQEMERAVKGLGESVTHTQDRTSALLERQNESTEALTELVVSLSELTQLQESAADHVNSSLQDVRTTIGRLIELHESLTPTTGAIVASGETLRAATAEFRHGSEQLQAAYAENLGGLQLALDEVKEVASEYASQFEVIRTGLQGIFEQVQVGLTSYQNETSNSLNRYLGDFATQLAAASSALSGSVSALSESLEDLNDFAEKLGAMSRRDGVTAGGAR
jgi:ABC-type transporter Mla subunit MlaD